MILKCQSLEKNSLSGWAFTRSYQWLWSAQVLESSSLPGRVFTRSCQWLWSAQPLERRLTPWMGVHTFLSVALIWSSTGDSVVQARLGLQTPALARLSTARASQNWSLSCRHGLGLAWARLRLKPRPGWSLSTAQAILGSVSHSHSNSYDKLIFTSAIHPTWHPLPRQRMLAVLHLRTRDPMWDHKQESYKEWRTLRRLQNNWTLIHSSSESFNESIFFLFLKFSSLTPSS